MIRPVTLHRMKVSHRSILLASGVLLFAGCGKKTVSTASGPEPLAVVGGEQILPEDLLSEISWRRSNGQFVPAPEELLQQMVDRLAAVQRAKRAGLDKDPDTRRKMEIQLVASLRERELEEKIRGIQITDAEVEAAYQEDIQRHTKKALHRFSIIFIGADSKASESRRQEALETIRSARARTLETPAPGGRGPSASGFGSLSAEFSEDQASRHRGGDIGWIEEGAGNTRFPANLLEAGFKLENGGISEPIETDAGFYLIRKTDHRPCGVTPLAEVAGNIRGNLLKKRRAAAEEAFVQETRDPANPRINAGALSAMKLPGHVPAGQAQPAPFPDVTTAPAP